jgi:hypothetical protein
MPVLDESHDERVLRILRDAKECLTAKQVTDILHGELGGGVSFTEAFVKARLAQLGEVCEGGGDTYHLKDVS